MDEVLEKIETYLINLFSGQFGSAILNKQLENINETRESFTIDKANDLLRSIETKVLKDFYGDDTSRIVRDIKKTAGIKAKLQL